MSTQSYQGIFFLLPSFPTGYSAKARLSIIATWSERCFSVSGGPKAAVYR